MQYFNWVCVFLGVGNERNVRSDAGTYALVGLVSMSLKDVFQDEWDCGFCKKTIAQLVDFVGLPKHVSLELQCSPRRISITGFSIGI